MIEAPLQDAQPEQLAPKPAYKPKRSRKAPAVQSAIMTRRALGHSKRKIAKELELSPNTVTSVLELNDFDAQLTSGRSLCAELIPSSVRVVKHRLAQNSENAAFKLLEGIGVLGKDAKGHMAGMRGDLMVNIQNLIQPAQSTTTLSTIESAPVSVNTDSIDVTPSK